MPKLLHMAIFLFLPFSAFAWGLGHEDHARLVAENLPSEISSFWNGDQKKSLIEIFSHYPDCVRKISPADRKIIGGDNMEFIDSLMPIRFRFHKNYGKAVSFIMLVKAFGERRPDAAAIFAGALLHADVDASAVNHGALTNYLSYLDYAGVKKVDEKYLDFSVVRIYPQIERKIVENVADEKRSEYAGNLEDAVLRLMLSSIDHSALMASVELSFLSFKNGNPDERYFSAAEKLFSYEVSNGISLVECAWNLAKSGVKIDEKLWLKRLNSVAKGKSDCEFARKFFGERARKIAARSAASDSLFFDFFPKDGEVRADVGMIAEPLLEMEESKLGFNSRMYTALIARSLAKSGKKVAMFCAHGADFSPNPSEIPMFVLCASSLPERLSEAFKAYFKNGGKILFVSANSDFSIVGFDKLIAKKNDDEVPVSSKYGKQNQRLMCDMRLVSPDGKPREFLNNPNTANGWGKPFANAAFYRAEGSFKPLMFLENGREKFCVSAAFFDKGKCRAIWAPTYAFSPFLFSAQDADFDWSKPELDLFGRGLILDFYNLMHDEK